MPKWYRKQTCFSVAWPTVLLLVAVAVWSAILLQATVSVGHHRSLGLEELFPTDVSNSGNETKSRSIGNDTKSSRIKSYLLPAFTGFPQVQTNQNFTTILGIGCCYPLDPVVKGYGNNQDSSGDLSSKICHTQRACEDASYPFASKEELEWFRPRNSALLAVNETEKGTPAYRARFLAVKHQSRQQCDHFLRQSPSIFADPKKEPKWCGGPLNKERYESRVPSGCGFNPFGFYVFPRAKLAMCLIPKAGLTQWFKFLRFTIGASDYQSLPYNKRDLRAMRMYDLPVERQLEILNDPSWTKGVFLRNPVERLLSAYLEKIRSTYSRVKLYENVSETLEDFVDALETRILSSNPHLCGQVGPSWCWDPHWRPQAFHCGIHEHLSRFDFVGRLDRAPNHTRMLLQKVGLWESYGKHFVTTKGVSGKKSDILPPNLSDTGRVANHGFQQDSQSKEDWHSSGASLKMQQYLGSDLKKELLSTIQNLYSSDLELWEALVDHTDDSWMTGRQLAEKVNPSCAG